MLLPALLLGCSAVSDPVLRIDPDPSIGTWLAGDRGPNVAALVETRAQARVSDAIQLDIVYPVSSDGTVALRDTPVVVFVHRGLVGPERYHWLPAYLATRGWTSVLPAADLELAITEPGHSRIALDRLQELSDDHDDLQGLVGADQPVVAMGHSLGGVMAAGHWATDDDVDALVLLASFPASFQPIEEATGPALALVGDTDVFDWEELESQLARMSGPANTARIDGMNHYAWTDDATEGDLDSDGPRTRAVQDTRDDALRVLDTWFDVRLFGADVTLLSGPFPGVEIP